MGRYVCPVSTFKAFFLCPSSCLELILLACKLVPLIFKPLFLADLFAALSNALVSKVFCACFYYLCCIITFNSQLLPMMNVFEQYQNKQLIRFHFVMSFSKLEISTRVLRNCFLIDLFFHFFSTFAMRCNCSLLFTLFQFQPIAKKAQ